MELVKPTPDERDAEEEVRRSCKSCGLVVSEYDPGSNRRLVEESSDVKVTPTKDQH